MVHGALPPRDLWPLGLLALAPLLVFALAATPRRAFAGGFAGGFLLYLLAMPWIRTVMFEYGGIDGATSTGLMLLLHAYLALFWGTFAWLVARTGAGDPRLALLAAPLLWAGLEWARSWLLSGFPWIPLSLTQSANLPLLQHASWGGTYAVSAIVVLPAAAAVALARPRTRRVGAGLALLVAGLWLGGALVLSRWEARLVDVPRPLRLGLVQALVPMEERWDASFRGAIRERHVAMSFDVVDGGANALVWSESSIPIPGGYAANEDARQFIRRLLGRLKVPLLFGSTTHEGEGDAEVVYNSAFAVAPTGFLSGRYDKQHLVPFGEYVPAQRLLFFAEKLVHEVSTFGRGQGPRLVQLDVVADGAKVRAEVGVPICYEIIFPEISRAFVRSGARVLVTITNDAWFGKSAAPEQHFAQAALRAIETRRFVARCANTGISGLVLPTGRVESRTAVFEPAAVVVAAGLLDGETPYVRFGEVVAPFGMLLAAFLAVRNPATPVLQSFGFRTTGE